MGKKHLTDKAQRRVVRPLAYPRIQQSQKCDREA